MLTIPVNLNVSPHSIPVVVPVKQYQTDAVIQFRLFTTRGTLNIGTLTEKKIRGTKADGNGFSKTVTYSSSTKTVSVQLEEQMTAVAGKQPFEIVLTDETGKMITATFYLDVQRAALDGGTISNSKILELVSSLDHAREIVAAYEGAQSFYSDVYMNFSDLQTYTIGKVINRSDGSVTNATKWLITGSINTRNFKAIKMHPDPNYKYRIYGYTSVITVNTSQNSALREAYAGYVDDHVFEGQLEVIAPSWAMIVIGIARTDGEDVTESDWAARGLIDAYAPVFEKIQAKVSEIEARLTRFQKRAYPEFYMNFGDLNSHYIGYVMNRSTGEIENLAERWLVTGAIKTTNFKALLMNASDDYKYRIYGYTEHISVQTSNNASLRAAYAGYIDDTQFDGRVEVMDPSWKMITIGIARMDGEYVTESDWDARYLIDAYRDKTSDAYGVTVTKNNPTSISEFLAVAETYRSNTNLTYGYSSILSSSSSTNYIDCSTFVGMCLRGYSFQQTSYYTHNYVAPSHWVANSEYTWSINPFDYENALNVGSPTQQTIRTASQLAQWMVERGRTVPMDEHLANLEPGDILFYSRKDSTTGNWVDPNRYMRINHIAICRSKAAAPTNDSSWDTTKYPYKHELIEVGIYDNPVKVRVVEDGQDDPTDIYHNNINTLCLICRPEMALYG